MPLPSIRTPISHPLILASVIARTRPTTLRQTCDRPGQPHFRIGYAEHVLICVLKSRRRSRMADRFGSTVAQEAGEPSATWGVGSFGGDGGTWVSKRWPAGCTGTPAPVSRSEAPRTTPDEGVIEATYQVIDDEKGTTPMNEECWNGSSRRRRTTARGPGDASDSEPVRQAATGVKLRPIASTPGCSTAVSRCPRSNH